LDKKQNAILNKKTFEQKQNAILNKKHSNKSKTLF